MRTFNREKVREIAIDKPNKQQIYIADTHHRKLVIRTLLEMGFRTNLDDMMSSENYHPIVVNTLKKEFFSIRTGLMACAAQSGAKALTFDKMLNLIDT